MNKERLDQSMVRRGLVATRSQAESYIKMGQVNVNNQVISKPGYSVKPEDAVKLTAKEQFVSRAGLKLASAATALGLDFRGKVVLDVGSSTGGFTDYALQHDARKIIAVDSGSNQMHPTLLLDPRIELHEQTDIRELGTLSAPADYVLIDVSFTSLREILPSVSKLAPSARVVAMAKPQFEAAHSGMKHKGVVKNERMRREILKDFEQWARSSFKIIDKADSQVAGGKGNKERFYLLALLPGAATKA